MVDPDVVREDGGNAIVVDDVVDSQVTDNNIARAVDDETEAVNGAAFADADDGCVVDWSDVLTAIAIIQRPRQCRQSRGSSPRTHRTLAP